MRQDIHGLGWMLRRTRDVGKLGRFYQDVVGLAAVRVSDTAFVVSLGEAAVMEIAPGPIDNPVYQDRSESPCSPVFRVTDVDAVIARLKAAGVRFINEPFSVPGGRIAYFVDPDGNVNGVQQRERSSTAPEDIEAFRRFDAGDIGLTGAPPMPLDIQNMGWVVVRCTDLQKELAFYRDTFGLTVRHATERNALLSLGDVCVLELALGCPPLPIPTDRDQVATLFMFRVADIDALAAELKGGGIHFVNDPFDLPGGRVGYFVDPEGHTIGIHTRQESSMRVEDIEVRRRLAVGRRPT